MRGEAQDYQNENKLNGNRMDCMYCGFCNLFYLCDFYNIYDFPTFT